MKITKLVFSFLLNSILLSCGSDNTATLDVAGSEALRIDQVAKEFKLIFPTYSKKHAWHAEYTSTILSQFEIYPQLNTLIDSKLNAADLRLLKCSGYKSASVEEKKNFWVVLLASMAYAESGLNPNLTYREQDGSLSSGLLQIDKESANRHAQRYTKRRYTQSDVLNPHYNLRAGLFIMKHQLEGGIGRNRPDVKNRIFTDQTYYWSVLKLKREKIIKHFSENAKTYLTFCQ